MRKKQETASMFVPKSEQPYQIPDNWRWVRLGAVCNFIGGGTPSKKNPEYWNGSIPWASVKDIKGTYLTNTIDAITEEGLRNSASNLCEVGDLIMITRIEPAKTTIAQIITAVNQDLKIVKSPLSSLFLHYYFRTFRQRFLDMASGSTVLGITIANVERAPFPLPPLAEQQRIVDRIESLFTKLDAARENAQAVLDGFETRKAAILYRAFSGELTEQWRKANGVSLDSWTHRGFESCVQKMQNGLAKRKGMTGNPVVVLRLANLSDDGFLTDDLRKIVLDEKEQSLYSLNPGDVLMIRVNGSKENVGKQFLITSQNAWAFCDHIIRIKYSHDIQPEYMTFFSNSETYKQYMKSHIVSSAGQNTISKRAMADLFIPVPTMEEQSEIVRLLSGIFAKEGEVKATAQQVIDNIDAMKKAILGRAFRGELGTNDPSEESPELAISVL